MKYRFDQTAGCATPPSLGCSGRHDATLQHRSSASSVDSGGGWTACTRPTKGRAGDVAPSG
uniref:Uncharacterized protein n=1 Tax=Leersia perrieri TaxID=77586 RepID=A0A0D9W0K0_9ORYZ